MFFLNLSLYSYSGLFLDIENLFQLYFIKIDFYIIHIVFHFNEMGGALLVFQKLV